MPKNDVETEHGEMFTIWPIRPFWVSNWHLQRKFVFYVKNLSTKLKTLKKLSRSGKTDMNASPFSKAATPSIGVVVPLTVPHTTPEIIGLAKLHSFILTESLVRNSRRVIKCQ